MCRSTTGLLLLLLLQLLLVVAVRSYSVTDSVTASSTECDLCEWMVQRVETWVAENRTVAEILELAEAACLLDPLDYDACKRMVLAYVPEVARMLSASAPPAEVCSLVGLCGPVVIHVHVVDSASVAGGVTNLLVRGGNPVVGSNGSFDPAAMQAALAAAAKAAGVAMPAKYVLVDIDLENFDQTNSADRGHGVAEFSFFAKNPAAGSYRFWQTVGTSANASDPSLPAAVVSYLAHSFPAWQSDQLPARVAALRQLLTSADPSGLPRVVFFHCDCGCDRTGEMGGAYWLAQMNVPFATVIERNTDIAGRPMLCNNFLALQWYCLYLNAEEGRGFDCMRVTNPCTPL